MLDIPYISFISQNNSVKMYHHYLHFIERKIGALRGKLIYLRVLPSKWLIWD